MNVLYGLKAAWKALEEFKKSNVSNGNIISDGEVVFSGDNQIIEAKLDGLLQRLNERDYSGKSILKDFVYDIVNRDTRIYTKNKKANCWQYKEIVNGDNKYHHFELVVAHNRIMIIDVITALDGYLLSFDAMYHTDMREYFDNRGSSVNKFGTTVINIDCPKDGIITFEDKIYNLDLLNGAEFSQQELGESIVSEYQSSLLEGKRRK